MSVLDASALLAWLKDEPGAEVVQAALDTEETVISAVNLAEVLTCFQEAGHAPEAVTAGLRTLGVRTIPYMDADARDTARLQSLTRERGLSLGDRVCLALGVRLEQPVLTANRAWADLDLPVSVQVIR